MASSMCIKCGDPNHIKKDCTNAWKPTKEEKKKTEKGKEKAAKVSTITATVDVVPEPIFYGHIISEDKLDFEVDELDTQLKRGLPCTSGQAVSQDWFSICVVRKGISVKDWKEEHEGELMHIEPVLISSFSRNHSISQKTKRVQKRKAGDELATLISALEKRPRTVAALDISLARNPVSNFSLVGKSSTKVLRPGGMKFHIPVKLSWVYGGNTRMITVNALSDTGAEVTILDTDFVEQMMMP